MKFHLGHLLGFSAVILAISAAFFSVTGLGQLFLGASMAVIIMASALEVSKLIIATFLHRYWSDISKSLRIYLTMAVIVLVCITSGGIYGFLSSAYQQTATELGIHDNKIKLIDNKIGLIKNKVEDNNKLINSKLERYNNLVDLRKVQEVRLDSMINRRYFSNANRTRDEIDKASDEMVKLQANVDTLNVFNGRLNDSIAKFEVAKMELSVSSTIAGEVGSLKYIAELTGQPMDVIVNYLILLLIFVFDPLAICLVVATNWVFERKKLDNVRPEVPKKTYTDPTTGTIHFGEDFEEKAATIFKDKIEEPVEESDEEEMVVTDDYMDNEAGPDVHDIEPKVVDVNEIEVIEPEEVEPEPKERKKLSIEDIETVGPYSKSKRGFSTNIPEPKTSTERRIGTNKVLKDENKVVYKKKGDGENE
jgi:hypothetical protein